MGLVIRLLTYTRVVDLGTNIEYVEGGIIRFPQFLGSNSDILS